MANMSYCRFHNTAIDMADCADAIMRMVDGCEGELSQDERIGLQSLFRSMGEIMQTIQSHTGKEAKDQADEMMWQPREFAEWFLNSLPEQASEDDDDE